MKNKNLLNQKTNNKIWLVEWHDAHSGSGWFYDKEVDNFISKERCICQNVGWILSESKDEIVLSCRKMRFTEDGDAQWGMLQKIPKAWIRKKIIYNDHKILKRRTEKD